MSSKVHAPIIERITHSTVMLQDVPLEVGLTSSTTFSVHKFSRAGHFQWREGVPESYILAFLSGTSVSIIPPQGVEAGT